MIISHKYKYIFLKTTKTAGTSIEISLSRFCGEDDIITPISSKDEKIRQEFGVFPQNHENYTRPLELREYRLQHLKNLISTGKRPQLATTFWNHMPASKVKQAISSKCWRSYYKFCFVRNPWDRAVSRYYWNLKKPGGDKIEDLSESLKKNNPNSNFNIYTIDQKIAVDYVGKYESLMQDLGYICNRLDIPFDNWLPNAKAGVRTDKRHYSEVFNEDQANFIREKCSDEIKWFDYGF
ncbi:MAG: sulfotransferase family 2 domain-containing protein [Cyanothece sp. SIO1E1]|nr:sulfotransferase family 2 domain-containing protein [Cyanothece sp. SIO1E1]